MNIVNRIKQKLHEDVICTPLSHGWVLNLYLNGERYPQKVCDYFQTEYAPTQELADQLTLHACDEHKHERLFEKSLRMIRQPAVDLPMGDVFNEVVRSFTPDTFHIIETDSVEVRRRKLANFLAHAHFLEKRIANSLRYHRDACEARQCDSVAKVVSAVLKDEDRHERYTREFVWELLTRREASETLEAHRRAEAKANLRFSSMQIDGFLRRVGEEVPTRRRLLYRFCGMIMEEAVRYV